MNRKQRTEIKKDKSLIIGLYFIIKKYLPEEDFKEKDDFER